MRRILIIPLLACVLFGAIPGVFAQEVQPPKTEDDNGYSQIAIFAKALELIRQDYVDENKTGYHDLVTAAMKGMLSSLDPHSQFMDPNDFRDMQDDTRSKSLEYFLMALEILILVLKRHYPVPGNIFPDLGNAQATFVVQPLFPV